MSRATQDAQVAKQAKAQIAHSQKANDAKQAKLTGPKDTRPSKGPTTHVVDPMPAHGATDKAPHTKRALQQAKGDAKIHDIAGNFVPADKRNADLIVGNVQYANKARAGEAKRQAEAAPKQAKAPVTAKAKAPQAKVTDDRKIVMVTKENPYREGTKAYVTFDMFKRVGTVSAARAEAEKTGGSGAKGKYDIGYLRYSSRDGHIKFA